MSPHRSVSLAACLAALAATLALTACGGGSGGGSDALAQGVEAVVGYVQPGAGGARTTLGITVLDVRQGTQEELEQGGLQVDPEDLSSTPYYVDVRYENQGEETVERSASVSLEDSDGNLIGSTLIIDLGGSPFEPCTNVNEGNLAPGESFEDCTLFLVPEGVEVGTVSFLSDNGPTTEPEFVYWQAE